MTVAADNNRLNAADRASRAPSGRVAVAALAGMAAAWFAAGSTGLLSHPLRNGLTWLALAVVVLAS